VAEFGEVEKKDVLLGIFLLVRYRLIVQRCFIDTSLCSKWRGLVSVGRFVLLLLSFSFYMSKVYYLLLFLLCWVFGIRLLSKGVLR
jgi:hypothetical protein